MNLILDAKDAVIILSGTEEQWKLNKKYRIIFHRTPLNYCLISTPVQRVPSIEPCLRIVLLVICEYENLQTFSNFRVQNVQDVLPGLKRTL